MGSGSAADNSLTAGRVGSNRAWRSDPAGPSPNGERRRVMSPNPAPLLPRQRPRVGPWPGRQRRGNGSSPHWNVKAGPALSGPFARGEKLGVADLGRPDFEILGGLVIILRQQSERHFQIVLPRQVGQLPEMACPVATVGNVDHPRETARPVNRSHSAACAAGSDPD